MISPSQRPLPTASRVMYGGTAVEEGRSCEVIAALNHP
jgi:hypothetical protein